MSRARVNSIAESGSMERHRRLLPHAGQASTTLGIGCLVQYLHARVGGGGGDWGWSDRAHGTPGSNPDLAIYDLADTSPDVRKKVPVLLTAFTIVVG